MSQVAAAGTEVPEVTSLSGTCASAGREETQKSPVPVAEVAEVADDHPLLSSVGEQTSSFSCSICGLGPEDRSADCLLVEMVRCSARPHSSHLEAFGFGVQNVSAMPTFTR